MNRHWLPLVLWGAAVCVLFSPAGHGQPLEEKNPFMRPDFQPPEEKPPPPGAKETAANLEFRGVYRLDERYYINIFDKKENKGAWVTVNEHGGEYKVTRYDPETDTITIRVNNRDEILTLAKPSDKPMNIKVTRIPPPAQKARKKKPRASGRKRRPVVRPRGKN